MIYLSTNSRLANGQNGSLKVELLFQDQLMELLFMIINFGFLLVSMAIVDSMTCGQFHWCRVKIAVGKKLFRTVIVHLHVVTSLLQ